MSAGAPHRQRSAKHRLRVATGVLPGLSEAEAVVWVEGEEAHHAARVLRVRAGEGVRLMDGRGWEADAEVAEAASGRVGCRVTGGLRCLERVRPRVTVVAPAAKGSRGDEMADQMAQAGADRWVVLSSERSVVEPGAGKLAKWRRRSEEASKQCGRAWDLAVAGPVSFAEAVSWAAGEGVAGWLMDVGEGAAPNRSLRSQLAWRHQPQGELEEVMVLVGPEGGWTDGERSAALAAGWRAWTVGRYVMRLETAAVVGAAMLATGVHSTDG
ncbi:MAG: RsmE family RNA methyltransferase [Planctomycetota bacterium]